MIAVNVLGFVTNASSPKLLKDHPLLLMALNPRYRYMVVAAPRVGALQFYLIGVGRLLLTDPVYFLLGWFYGERAISYFSDALGEQTIESTRRFFLRASTVMALFFAGPVICVLAGASRMRARLFFTLDVIGTIVVVALLRLFSHSMEGFIKSFLRFNDHNYKWLMVFTVATTVFVVARVGSKRVRAAKRFTDDV